MRPLKLTPAEGGWLHADWGDGKAWLRLGKDKRDRLNRIVELHLFDPTPERLRRLPLERIHAAVTMRGASAVQLALALRINDPVPLDLFTRPVDGGLTLTGRDRHRLKRPASKLLGDDFYRDVAHAYKSAMWVGLEPRQALATDTGAADATVARWVGEARRRGHLPKARPGKATA